MLQKASCGVTGATLAESRKVMYDTLHVGVRIRATSVAMVYLGGKSMVSTECQCRKDCLDVKAKT